MTAILGLLAFVLRYTGRVRWLKTRRFGAICAPALPLILLAWTDPGTISSGRGSRTRGSASP